MSIWFAEIDLEQINLDRRRTLSENLDIQITEVGEDYLRATMPVDERTHQPFGLLHGGASVALAETVASIGANLVLDPSRQAAVGVEINANHLKGVRSGRVTATARPLHIGRSTQVWQIDIEDENGRPVCASRMTAGVLDKS